MHADEIDVMYIRLLINGKNGIRTQKETILLYLMINSFAIPRRKVINMMA